MKFFNIFIPIIIVFALLGCSTAKTQSTNLDNTQAIPTEQVLLAATDSTQLTTVSFEWVGKDLDLLSPSKLEPDGETDANFHITVPFSEPSAVKSIFIRYTEFGKSLKWGWISNKNLTPTGYVMGVFDKEGKPILQQDDNGYRVDGLTVFNLYISELNNEKNRDTFKFDLNQSFNLEINYITQNNEVKKFDGLVKIR